MAKFRYYITDLFDGVIRGTDNDETANSFASCEDFFVVDTHSGEWLASDNDRLEVQEVENHK